MTPRQIRKYERYLHNRWDGRDLPDSGIDWPLSVWVRIIVEALWYCSASLIALQIIANVTSDIYIPRNTILWLSFSSVIFFLCRFLPSHVSISIGRALGGIILWAAVFTSSLGTT